MKIAIIDNYDSFTYNLVHAVKKITKKNIDIIFNNKLELYQLEKYDKIILSPGPGIPSEAGLLMKIIANYAENKSILGVCLGHQAIAEYFGAKLINMKTVLHGIASQAEITIKDDVLFKGINKKFQIGHYHSWIVSNENFPQCLEVTSVDDKNQIMSLKHKTLDVRGVQFHPESILTPQGELIIKNWLNN